MSASKVIMITGSSRGIGLGLAEHYLTEGQIVCGCSRAPTAIKHPLYSHFELDVSHEASVVQMVRECVREHGRIDALINNAGIASMNSLLLSPASTAQAIFATNFHGTFLFCREVAKSMIRQKSGRIINFSTVATPLRLAGESLYAASKAAVESMTKILAVELGAAGITVNAIGPTPVLTDLIKSVPKGKMDALLARQAIARFGELKDIVNVIDFYLSPQSDFITGQVLYLGGVTN